MPVCYYLRIGIDEAAYLAVLLNAPCLQSAFQESRASDRHFHLHPLRKVPIPSFDFEDPRHRELVGLCDLAEKTAQKTIDEMPENTGQIKASNLIRRELRLEGIADAIDETVRLILPSHSVMEYTEEFPHPWGPPTR